MFGAADVNNLPVAATGIVDIDGLSRAIAGLDRIEIDGSRIEDDIAADITRDRQLDLSVVRLVDRDRNRRLALAQEAPRIELDGNARPSPTSRGSV